MPKTLSPYELEFGRRPATPEDRDGNPRSDRTSLRRHRRTRASGVVAFDQRLAVVRRVLIIVEA
jgi:hypothetical protein